MPVELWTKIVTDIPILAVLLVVLWRGGEKLDNLGKKMDKQTDATNKQTVALNSLAAKVELVGKIQDVRLDLHEERTTGKHKVVTEAAAARAVNGAQSARRAPHPSWPDAEVPEEDEG